jgi:hypothetical protein
MASLLCFRRFCEQAFYGSAAYSAHLSQFGKSTKVLAYFLLDDPMLHLKQGGRGRRIYGNTQHDA